MRANISDTALISGFDNSKPRFALEPSLRLKVVVTWNASPLRSGRALGTQNTFQNIIYAATPPLAGAVVAGIGFPALFALSAVFPAVALAVGPRDDERRHATLEP